MLSSHRLTPRLLIKINHLESHGDTHTHARTQAQAPRARVTALCIWVCCVLRPPEPTPDSEAPGDPQPPLVQNPLWTIPFLWSDPNSHCLNFLDWNAFLTLLVSAKPAVRPGGRVLFPLRTQHGQHFAAEIKSKTKRRDFLKFSWERPKQNHARLKSVHLRD